MTTTSALSPTQHPTGYRHEALFWDGTEEFLAGTVPFVSAGLAAGMPVLVAVHDERWQALRSALGADADRVQQLDVAELGHNPARIIPVWREFVAQAADRPCRGIGEPIRDGMRDAHLAECQVHEAALNVAVPPSAPLWLLCSYDTGSLDAEVLDEARRSHPVVTSLSGAVPARYAGPTHTEVLAAQGLPRPRASTEYRRYRKGDLGRIRRFVADRAREAGVADDRIDDLCLAVNELAANSIDHGGGAGFLRMWCESDRLIVEVSDAGRITDRWSAGWTPAPSRNADAACGWPSSCATWCRPARRRAAPYSGPSPGSERLHPPRDARSGAFRQHPGGRLREHAEPVPTSVGTAVEGLVLCPGARRGVVVRHLGHRSGLVGGPGQPLLALAELRLPVRQHPLVTGVGGSETGQEVRVVVGRHRRPRTLVLGEP